jgi:hypothetical protein
MSSPAPVTICDDVKRAVRGVRLRIQSGSEVSQVLDAFWCLQDQVHRLVASASDSPYEILSALKTECPRLIQDIIALLDFTAKVHFRHIAAVERSCTALNDSLMELERLKRQ